MDLSRTALGPAIVWKPTRLTRERRAERRLAAGRPASLTAARRRQPLRLLEPGALAAWSRGWPLRLQSARPPTRAVAQLVSSCRPQPYLALLNVNLADAGRPLRGEPRPATLGDPPGRVGCPEVPFQQVLDGVLLVSQTGCQWETVPREFGSRSMVHARFQEWMPQGV